MAVIGDVGANVWNWVKSNLQVLTAAGAIVGFSITTIIQVGYMRETLRVSDRSNSIILSRAFVEKFDETPLFFQIEASIVAGDKLYAGYHGDAGGAYSWQELNSYLGFFEEIATYRKLGALDLTIIDTLFGAHILEAYLDDDIREYVFQLRNEGGQIDAFIEFQRVAEEIISKPARAVHVKAYRTNFETWGF